MSKTFVKEMEVVHEDFGSGEIVEYCQDANFIQVQFDREPPRPDGVNQSSNPMVVPVESLKKKQK